VKARLRLEVTETGASEAALDLHRLGQRAGDVAPAGGEVKRIFHDAERRTFGASGPGWPPVSQPTSERKAREGLSTSLLRASDRLYESLTQMFGSHQIDVRSADELRFGTTVQYARYHDQGTRSMPRRRLTQPTPSEQRDMVAAVERHVARGDPLW
jgi:hypothetical protein